MGILPNTSKALKKMLPQADGGFLITLILAIGHDYRFRFTLDGQRWESDWAADAYVPNPFGTEDSILRL
jgi:hypothetical protein